MEYKREDNKKSMEPLAQEIFELVMIKLREQAAYNRDAYKQLVEETLDYFNERGKIDEDENVEFIEDQLMNMWEQVETELGEEQ
ncbi:MAG TPA: hypothetical protein PK720_03050 [bacterium]|nr:hypothetical protein [bacterium]